MFSELQTFLTSRGKATSWTSPQANGQCERLNGVIWKTVLLGLESCKLDVMRWETVLPDALHSIQSLLSMATNCTPHEQLFAYGCCSSGGYTLLRCQIRIKSDPLVDEVTLLEANPRYAHIHFPDDREDTVSLNDLVLVTAAPAPPPPQGVDLESAKQQLQLGDQDLPGGTATKKETDKIMPDQVFPRWSGQERCVPDCYSP